MKVLQTSDIHVGECRSLPDYLDRHRSILSQIRKTAIERQLPLLVPGDLFHDTKTTFDEKFLVDWWIATLERDHVPTIITAGNHDHILGNKTQLDGYKHYPLKFVKIVTWEPEVHTIGNAGFICLSWRAYKTQDIKDVVENLLPQIENCQFKVVLLHECITGSEFDSGILAQSLCKLPDIPVIDYWAVGDIHKHQKANLPNSWYAGAPAQFKFNDVLKKGMIIVDLESPSNAPEFININVKPLKTVAAVKDITEDAYYKVKGDLQQVLEANKNINVIKTERSNIEYKPIEVEKIGPTQGLPEFLAQKGIDENWQKYAVNWVNEVIQRREGVE